MAKHGNLMLSGKSGEKHCFQTWPFATHFRPVGAVFLITRRVMGEGNTFRRAAHEVLYVGQTSRMSDPLGTPGQLESLAKRGANYVCVCPVADEARRMQLFEDFREGYAALAEV